MTWTYSGNPADGDKDRYRFLIGDTDSSQPVLQDEEIEYIIAAYVSNNVRLWQLYENAANVLARAVKRSLGPESEDPSERTKYFKEQATYYRQLVQVSSGLSLPKSAPPIFYKGMHDNV